MMKMDKAAEDHNSHWMRNTTKQIIALKFYMILGAGYTCKGLREGLSNLLPSLLRAAEGRVKSHPTTDAGPITIFAAKTKK